MHDINHLLEGEGGAHVLQISHAVNSKGPVLDDCESRYIGGWFSSAKGARRAEGKQESETRTRTGQGQTGVVSNKGVRFVRLDPKKQC